MKYLLLIIFFVFIVTYHLRHTFLGFGMEIVPPEYLSVGKDLVWIGLIVRLLIVAKKQTQTFYRDWKLIIFVFIGLVFWSLCLSWYEGMSWGSIVVGAKYDLYPLFVLLSALAVGYGYYDSRHIGEEKLVRVLLSILGFGLLRQVSKQLIPEFFHRWGYGPIGDYVLGVEPPVYYRTGPGGIARLQGIFAGPNNYGFFLVGIAGVVSSLILSRGKKSIHWLLGILYFITLTWTLSRGAWVSAGVTIMLTIIYYFPMYKKWLFILGGMGVLGVFGISIYKAGSTSGHRIALVEGLQAVARQPRGYGLGMAGPSVHYEGVYLPENQYMQLLLDLGVIGCALWVTIFGVIAYRFRQEKKVYDTYLVLLFFGIIGMSVEGLFLHVREDSMVNYLLLGVFGIWYGASRYALHKK